MLNCGQEINKSHASSPLQASSLDRLFYVGPPCHKHPLIDILSCVAALKPLYFIKSCFFFNYYFYIFLDYFNIKNIFLDYFNYITALFHSCIKK
jgi:hypothetical protein